MLSSFFIVILSTYAVVTVVSHPGGIPPQRGMGLQVNNFKSFDYIAANRRFTFKDYFMHLLGFAV